MASLKFLSSLKNSSRARLLIRCDLISEVDGFKIENQVFAPGFVVAGVGSGCEKVDHRRDIEVIQVSSIRDQAHHSKFSGGLVYNILDKHSLPISLGNLD